MVFLIMNFNGYNALHGKHIFAFISNSPFLSKLDVDQLSFGRFGQFKCQINPENLLDT